MRNAAGGGCESNGGVLAGILATAAHDAARRKTGGTDRCREVPGAGGGTVEDRRRAGVGAGAAEAAFPKPEVNLREAAVTGAQNALRASVGAGTTAGA
jgi:hypothetical protein